MLLAQHGFVGATQNRFIPTDDTKTYSLIETFGVAGKYYLSSLLHQRPGNPEIIIHTYTDGDYHTDDPAKKIVYRKSTDRGLTYGSQADIYNPTDSTYFVQDPGIGYGNNGRLHVLADCHESFSTGVGHELRYLYSDDDAATFSSPTTITLPSNGLDSFRMYGRIIQAGNVLMAPCYFFTDEGDFTNSARYILRSTDNGANWTWIEVETTSAYINESELLAVTNNIIFMVSRQEATPHQFIMYKSLDAGLTWSNVGVLSTSVVMSISAPCRLHKFRADNGTWMSVMYFTNKSTATIYAIYGRLDVGVDGGLGLFNLTTLTQMRDDTVILHYGDMCHYNGNMNARGAWSREINNPNDNVIQYAEFPATHYDSVTAILLPITIYDKLASLQFIAAWRGLVSNTTNDYGVVNGSSQVTTWKSILPGPTGRDFTGTAGGIVLGDGLEFDGTKRLANSTATNWNFLQYSSAGESDMNYTIYFKSKFGTSSNPNDAYGLIGNNGSSAGNKGIALFYDDRSGSSQSDAIRFLIAKGSAGFIIDFHNQNMITPNAFAVFCLEVDLSQSTNNNKVKFYINNVLQSTTVTAYNTGVQITSTYNIQIGATGNDVLPFIGSVKDIIIQNAIDLPSVRTNFTQALIDAS